MNSRTFVSSLTIILMILFVYPTSAQVYKWVDDKGNFHFTDTPTGNQAEKRNKVEEKRYRPKAKSTVMDKSDGTGYSYLKKYKREERNSRSRGGKGEILTFTSKSFKREMLRSRGLTMVEFWGIWCGVCERMAPNVKRVANSYAGKMKIGKVDIDREKKVSNKYKVNSIPRYLFSRNGKLVRQKIGYVNLTEMTAIIDGLL